MIVYRYLSEKELSAFITGNIENIGALYKREFYKNINSHNYKNGLKYVHFFKNLKDFYNIRNIYKENKDLRFLCRFDIPRSTLFMTRGSGKYESSGYDVDHYVVKEYAVPLEKLQTKFLLSYIKDENRNISIEAVEKEFIEIEENQNKEQL